METIASTEIKCSGSNLSQVKYYEGEKSLVKSLKFDYAPGKVCLLQSITQENTADGVYMEYEPNKCDGVTLYLIPSSYPPTYSIGVRLKRLVARHAEQSDTINYHYPMKGVLVYDSLTNFDIITYTDAAGNPTFCDTLIFDKIRSKGLPILKTGNNGIYYPYVEEEFAGRGKNKYLFYAPRRWSLGERLRGLPLAKASFDNNGKMLELEQWKYYTDLTRKHKNNYDDYFYACPSAYAYDKSYDNMRASEYTPKYDKTDYLNSYNVAGEIIDEYQDYYLPNIYPRLRVKDCKYGYEIYGGGATTLKENVRYKIDDDYVAMNGVGDFSPPAEWLKELDHTEYFYDNPELSTSPTRIEKQLSNGDTAVQIIKNISEIQPGINSVIDEMRTDNILACPVKIISAIKKNANYYLNKESVFNYERSDYDGIKYFSIKDIRECAPPDLRPESITATTDQLYYFDATKYTLTKEFAYAKKRNHYAPTWESGPRESYGYGYNGLTGDRVFRCKSYSDSTYLHTIPDVDLKGFYSLKEAESLTKTCDTIKTFLKNYEILLKSDLDFSHLQQSQQDYLKSDFCLTVKHAIEDFLYLGEKRPYTLIRKPQKFCDIDAGNIAYFFNLFADNWRQIALELHIIEIPADQLAYMIGQIQALTLAHYHGYMRFHNRGNYMWYETAAANKANLFIKSAADKNYKLFILAACPNAVDFEYAVNNTTYTRSLQPTQYPMLQTFLVENQTRSSLIKLDLNETEGMKYIVIVPEDAEFEAVSYNTDGTILCKFDHTGKMERYEYDDAMRITKIFDHNGRIIKEYTYNNVLDRECKLNCVR